MVRCICLGMPAMPEYCAAKGHVSRVARRFAVSRRIIWLMPLGRPVHLPSYCHEAYSKSEVSRHSRYVYDLACSSTKFVYRCLVVVGFSRDSSPL